MKDYLTHNEWKIVEDQFHPEYNMITESVMSLGNGRMGHRANFEETFTGETLSGNYVAGVYYPDKTRVGWWKNGYPEYFAKVLNAANWGGLDVKVENEILDLAKARVMEFRRELDMKEGHLSRSFVAEMPSGKQVAVESKRFLSIVDPAIGVVRYSLKALNFSGTLFLTPYVNFDVMNQDSNYDEKFWDEVQQTVANGEGYVTAEVRKTLFHVTAGMKLRVLKNGEPIDFQADLERRHKYIGNIIRLEVAEGDELTIEKFGVNLSSEYHPKSGLQEEAARLLNAAFSKGYHTMLGEQINAWARKWETSDIIIEGDVAAQQGIRFNIFQLMQTYSGEDSRLNIGPKGFTGEKYGGSTYWDTEAYCLPFYLATAPQEVSKNLLRYRHKHLKRAIENAEKLGFKNGAALYPMVTMNGEECHNEWEITFEEIHRNGAIAFAIYDYIRYTGDVDYLAPEGFEVLLGISRFWAQRVNWSANHEKYVMLGVTGPNEYENNVNNNYHTSKLAQWTLQYTLEVIDILKDRYPAKYDAAVAEWEFREAEETAHWKDIIEKIYFPYDETRQVYLQQDGFLDKELIPVNELSASDRPINQNWSWDRILRSCYIKQADTLQSLFLFEEEFTTESLQRHYDFYEPLTVHESSLSPCIHAILAASLGNEEKTYEMYLRTARLDLDDYNNDTEDGCHITSMGGTWMSFVMGFGGMRVRDNRLHLNPFLPKSWRSYAFHLNFRGARLEIMMKNHELTIRNRTEVAAEIAVKGENYTIAGGENVTIVQ